MSAAGRLGRGAVRARAVCVLASVFAYFTQCETSKPEEELKKNKLS